MASIEVSAHLDTPCVFLIVELDSVFFLYHFRINLIRVDDESL
jgi:hypothetical protein